MKRLKSFSINGEAYPISFDVYAITMIMEETELSYGDLMRKLAGMEDFQSSTAEDLKFVFKVIRKGFENACEDQGIKFEVTDRQLMKVPGLMNEALTILGNDIRTYIHGEKETEPDQKKAEPGPKKGKK